MPSGPAARRRPPERPTERRASSASHPPTHPPPCAVGGSYTIRNVSRCWTFETSVILGQEVADELPYNDYYEYYGPEYRLHIQP